MTGRSEAVENMEQKLIGYDPDYEEHKLLYQVLANLIDNVWRIPRDMVGFPEEIIYG